MPEVSLLELMWWMRFDVFWDSYIWGVGGNSRTTSREVVVVVWRYVPNCATSRNTLTKNEQTYKTAKLCQTKASQKKTFEMPILYRCLWKPVNAKVGAQWHVTFLIFIRKELPQAQCMLVIPSWRCFHHFIIPLKKINR